MKPLPPTLLSEIVRLQSSLPPVFHYPWDGLEDAIQKMPGQTLAMVGYGSLMNQASASITIQSASTTRTPWLTFGCKRVFNYQMPPAAVSRYGSPRTPFERAALNVFITGDVHDMVNGIKITLAASDVPALRLREVGYDLVPVASIPWDWDDKTQPSIAYLLIAPDVAVKPEWQLVNAHLLPHAAYRRLCKEGASQISPDFLELFLTSSYLADKATSLKAWKQDRTTNWERAIQTQSPSMQFATTAAPTNVLVSLDSPLGSQLLRESQPSGSFYHLIRYFTPQENLNYCSIASSVMVLNALGVPRPSDEIHGPYAFFTQDNYFRPAVAAVVPPEIVARQGVTLAQMAAMLNANQDVAAQMVYAPDITVDDFRRQAIGLLDQSSAFLLINYSRPALGQDGGGHVSPVAAYHARADAFLVLDVSQYKYPPTWVPTSLLFTAMEAQDPSSNKPRGYVVVKAQLG
ncbi:MAG: phytochelatin synthase family protein [Verrucomicrobiaceae bacterium]|nr:phytochelatin synthase family protein [Verrucomicrobiaceae bacterium]